MNAPEDPFMRSALILKADRLIAETIVRAMCEVWSEARYRIESRVGVARAAVTAAPVDMLVTGLGMLDGDVCELARFCARPPRAAKRIVVITGRRDPRMLALLHELPIDGAFDSATESLQKLAPTLQEIQSGNRYFSRRFIDLQPGHQHSELDVFHHLTATELLILAVIGDGCDCQKAAERLELSFETIRSACRDIHRKLGIQHKGDLMRIAAQSGLVRFTSSGVERPGFELLVEHYEAARSRLKRRTPFVAALCLGQFPRA